MGQDYSYSQPSSSSNSIDMSSLLEAEAKMYADEAESPYCNAEPDQFPPQPEADDGIPTACYCGAQPVVKCSYTPKDPYRRHFSCPNVDDGGCHIWKWWDVALTEELSEVQRRVRQLKDQAFECDQKLLKLQKTVCEVKKKSENTNVFALAVCVMVSAIVFIGLAAMYLSGKYLSCAICLFLHDIFLKLLTV
ncbi:uncharacterized protein At4g04775-like [Brassica napus]|uniref:uncharacterized protein At4g04775-like n=1 Tax=Brassica napus TaxID=3708 RepID=UPI00207A0347|nr:uncharacterized protein At4g04775-like [Brassica napus]